MGDTSSLKMIPPMPTLYDNVDLTRLTRVLDDKVAKVDEKVANLSRLVTMLCESHKEMEQRLDVLSGQDATNEDWMIEMMSGEKVAEMKEKSNTDQKALESAESW